MVEDITKIEEKPISELKVAEVELKSVVEPRKIKKPPQEKMGFGSTIM